MTRVGVDTGGTFTDYVEIGPGSFRVSKVLSTPPDPSEAVLTAVEEAGVDLADVALFAHGTTVTTNAAIQRRGVPTGLLTTKGFRDVLQIRRTTRGELYNFQWEPPLELVPREWRLEVPERTDGQGNILQPPDLEVALAAIAFLVGAGIESLAICFINAYLNRENERAVQRVIAERYPDLPVYLSSEVLAEWREFERTSTTVVSAYIGPILAQYLNRLETELEKRGYRNDLLVMMANGGLSTTKATTDRPAYSIGSGPAAGVMAQLAIAAATDASLGGIDAGGKLGIPNVIGMDIGGTSTDISLIGDGIPALKSELEIEFGTTVSYPVIDIGSIGAGGGTIAWVDRGGFLHVGPQSAGSDPGPACLGRGGADPTVTDASVVLRRQNPKYLAGGTVTLYADAATDVIRELGERLNLGPTAMAKGVLQVTVANIVSAIRQRTIERGLDPREFSLMAYGGAGPLLATDVARELEVPAVLIPRHPGVTSALGLLLTDVRHDEVGTYLKVNTDVSAGEVAAAYDRLVRSVSEKLRREGFADDAIVVLYSADLRYVGQTHELTVRLPGAYAEEVHSRLASIFQQAHTKEFGHAGDLTDPIEIVNLRVAGVGRLPRPQLPEVEEGPRPVPGEVREVYFDREWINTPIFEREALGRGALIEGPTVVEQLDSTTVLPPGWVGVVDSLGTLMMRPSA